MPTKCSFTEKSRNYLNLVKISGNNSCSHHSGDIHHPQGQKKNMVGEQWHQTHVDHFLWLLWYGGSQVYTIRSIDRQSITISNAFTMLCNTNNQTCRDTKNWHHYNACTHFLGIWFRVPRPNIPLAHHSYSLDGAACGVWMFLSVKGTCLRSR